MRSDVRSIVGTFLAGRSLVAGAIAASVALAGCSRDVSDSSQDGVDAVRAILGVARDPNEINHYGDAMIHVAVLRADPAMLRTVLAHGAPVELRNQRNMTALGLAIEVGCLTCVHELLQAHADPNAPQAKKGEVPLGSAAARGEVEAVQILLASGADPNARNTSGEAPLHTLASADVYRGVLIAQLLLAHGADVHATDVLGETPVHKAALHDAVQLVEFYAAIGADLDARNAWGATPLDRALEKRRDNAAEKLYRLGAKAAITPNFEPPLVEAARTDDVERARWLVSYGADPLQPFHGQSALDIARANKNDDVLAVLSGPPGRL
jgi:ankyrin repeat protein